MVLREEAGLWAVADGMGGLQNGKWASCEAAALLQSVQMGRDFHLDVEAITGTIEQANDRILLAAGEAGTEMGTTIAVLHLFSGSFAALWVGDSRLYLSRNGCLYRLSHDHTQVQDLLDAGLLSEEEALRHPSRHVLSRAVGVEAQVRVDAVADSAQIHDTFLLCSDGLTCVVSDAEIGETLNSYSPQSAVSRLIDLTLARGAPDNVTVIAVRCEEATTQVRLGDCNV